ncbi:PD-(D/E)XK nuclease family protein [Ethanoligenens sp.]|uniref:PD-(D/E)XK nuclease family protein n=1 Tax=Ethanoligenens sp. TaxID=2099655 RepID=UPI0039ECFA7B
MLRLALGRAGSGKTWFALEKAAEAVADKQNAVLIVPEQFTFEMERALLQTAGPAACLHVEVLSFSRLAQRVFGLYGGAAGRAIDDCGRVLVMSMAAKQIGDLLQVYRRQAESPAFAKAMVDAVSELKHCGVDADALTAAAEKTEDAALSGKIEDLSLLMQTYDALCSRLFSDNLDDLARLAEKLADCPFFDGKTVIFDAFKGFTGPQKKVIGHILRQSAEVYMTFCTDSLNETEQGIGLFSPVKKTVGELLRLAHRLEVEVAKPLLLGSPRRFAAAALTALEERVFRQDSAPYADATPDLHIVSAGNLYEEAQFVAQEIARLVQTRGARYGEMVVISRGLPLYYGVLDPICKKYAIPLFLDAPRDVSAHPLMAFVLGALDLIAGNFRQEAVLRYLKTGLAGLTAIETAELENYLYTWNVQGLLSWQKEWTDHPDGFGNTTLPDDTRLEMLNRLRLRVLEPVEQLSSQLGGGAVQMQALYTFLVDMQVEQQMAEACAQFAKSGEQELEDEYRQVWDKLIGMFEQMAAVLGETAVPVPELLRMLRLAVASTELAHIPPTLDQVTAGDAERIRAGDAKYVFVIGLAEGVFPKTGNGGVLTDSEREKLIRMGLELSPPAEERLVEERFIAYQAFTCASHALYLCYPRSDTKGRVIQPSPYLAQVRAIFPNAKLYDTAAGDPLDAVWSAQSAFGQLAACFHQTDGLTAALRACFENWPQDVPRLRALERAAEKRPARLTDRAAARALFGERMHISPSRLEAYEQCRFLYFCRYGLKAMPRRRAELAAPEVGTLVHFVLEHLLQAHADEQLADIPRAELEAEIDRLLAAFADGYLGGLENKPERFKYLFLRLRGTVLVLVERLAAEFAQSQFVPVDFELPIGTDGGVPPSVLPLPDGGAIAVEGKVDRVDILKRGSRAYLRVVDYKTGSQNFQFADVLYGLNLQMFIYLFTLCDHAGARYDVQELLPAGVLYFPAKRPDVEALHGAAREEITKAADSKLKMNGMVTDEPEVIRGMEREARGLFIPAQLKQGTGEPDARAAVASLAQFGVLKRHVDRLLRQMASTLRAGDIAAVPVGGTAYHPCDYCDYAGVCGHEKGDPQRWIDKMGKADVWKAIEEAESSGAKAMDKRTETSD